MCYGVYSYDGSLLPEKSILAVLLYELEVKHQGIMRPGLAYV